jgi:isopropylmalate/homocitrate/citramalate synthase
MLGLSQMTREFAAANWYKPFVGEGVSDVEAGIPAKSMWENRNEPGMGREFLNYEVVGGKSATLVLGKKSGRFSIILKAHELNLPLPSEEQSNEMLTHVKNLSTEKKRLANDEEFKGIYNKVMSARG